MTRVGVLIAAKDAAGTIGRAVGSALTQAAVSEVIVIDDGSADGTAEAARLHDDGSGRLLVRSLPGTAGPAAARNHALGLGTAGIVAVLDADDHFLPGRIAAMLDGAGSDWDFAADGLIMLRADEPAAAGRRHDFRAELGVDMLSAETFILGNIARPGRMRRELGFMKPLMRRRFLDRMDLRYDARLRLGEDYILYAEALLRGARFRLLPGCGYVAAWRPDSLSGRHGSQDLVRLARASLGLLTIAGITPAQAAAIAAHARSVTRRAQYRIALDLKQQRRFAALAGFLCRNAGSVPYMIGETVRGMSG